MPSRLILVGKFASNLATRDSFAKMALPVKVEASGMAKMAFGETWRCCPLLVALTMRSRCSPIIPTFFPLLDVVVDGRVIIL